MSQRPSVRCANASQPGAKSPAVRPMPAGRMRTQTRAGFQRPSREGLLPTSNQGSCDAARIAEHPHRRMPGLYPSDARIQRPAQGRKCSERVCECKLQTSRLLPCAPALRRPEIRRAAGSVQPHGAPLKRQRRSAPVIRAFCFAKSEWCRTTYDVG